jgi:hypothetical protein
MANEITERLKLMRKHTSVLHSVARKQLVLCIVRKCKKRVRFEIMAEVVDDTLCGGGGGGATTTACNNVAQEEKANCLITSEYAGTSLLSKSLMLLLLQARFFLSFFLSWIR